MAINTFADHETEVCFHDSPDDVNPKCSWFLLRERVKEKLERLDSAVDMYDLRNPPSNKFEALRGKLNGFFSIRVDAKWRIVFRWTPLGVEDVRVADYH